MSNSSRVVVVAAGVFDDDQCHERQSACEDEKNNNVLGLWIYTPSTSNPLDEQLSLPIPALEQYENVSLAPGISCPSVR